jgi:hypothetical protein
MSFSKNRILLGTYFASMSSYGFYRGYNNLYYTKLYKTKKELLTDRIYDGIIGGVWQINPLMQPLFLYGIIRLIEKKQTNLKIIDEDYRY